MRMYWLRLPGGRVLSFPREMVLTVYVWLTSHGPYMFHGMEVLTYWDLLVGGVLLLQRLSIAEFPLYVAALVAGGCMFCWPPALFFILLAAGGVVVVEAVRGCCFLCLDTSHLQDNALHIWHSVCF